MRNTFKYIITIAASLLVGVSAFAQTQKTAAEAIKVGKTAEPNGDGTYTLSMEAFLTGYSNSSLNHITKPLDIVLVLDKSGSMGSAISYSYSAKNTSTYGWTYSNFGSNTYYYRENDDAYWPVKRGGSSGNRYLQITYHGETKYLTSKGISNNPESGKGNEATIWTGQLYNRGGSIGTRIAALKRACDAFVDAIKTNAEETGANHKIAIVNFAGVGKIGNNWSYEGDGNPNDNISNYEYDLTDDYDKLLGYINGRTGYTTYKFTDTWSGTYPTNALQRAKTKLDGSDRESVKIVVMFTDGTPGMATGFDRAFVDSDDDGADNSHYDNKTEANNAIAAAKDLKDAGYTVYTVGTFDGTAHDDVIKYMNYLSSNYPGASSQFPDVSGTPLPVADRVYTSNASDPDALTAVFQNIADTQTKNLGSGEDVIIDVNQVSVNDVVTPQFTVSGGVTGITVKVVNTLNATKVTDSEGNFVDENGLVWYTDDGYTWDETHAVVNPEGISVSLVGNNGEEKTVQITGFDFSANWVGLTEEYEDGERTEWAPHGAKLVISFVVAPDPYSDGGAASTNDQAKSGVFVGSTNPTVINFPEQPTRYTPMNLTISATGLAEGLGESVIFNIKSTDGLDMFVAFTEGEEKTQTIAQLPVVKADGTTMIEYTVTPVSAWGWTYEHPEAGDAQTLVGKSSYNFTVNPVAKTIKHAENAKNNVFE